jgi:DNA-directed RNA polymerase subunit beta
LDFEFDAKDIIYVRIDRRRKLPITTLLYALGLDGEEILHYYYNSIPYTEAKEGGWRTPFDPQRYRGLKPVVDLIDAKTKKVVVEAGKKITPRLARKLGDDGLKELLVRDEDLFGHYLADELVNPKTGEIYAEAGDEIDEKLLKKLKEAGFAKLNLLDIDHINTGAYIRNTMRADKAENYEQALLEIYRVMRPGEPPTRETAEALFNGLFFDAERYDLSAVGRVKMNMRLELDAPDTMRVLRREDILAVIKTLAELRDGKGEIDDIDHLGNRRVRSVGELMENQYRLGLVRMERAIKERMSSIDIDTVMPHQR